MEGNRQPLFKKRPNPQFKKKGGNKKGKWHNSSREQSFGNSNASDTVYRILCHSRKIGSVIGKGGSIVQALREETLAKITVADSVPGSDERVIIIYSPSTKIYEKHNSDNDQDAATDKEGDPMEPHCPAQDALLKVHDRIIEENLVGGMEDEDGNENVVTVTARLLVPNNMVGCLLGKKGDVIQRLRSDTGASIRVLPAEHLPSCAESTDELVQISAKPAAAKRALYEVSTLLHQNPRKDKPPSSFPMPHRGQGFHPPGPPMANMPPPGNPMWSQRHSNSHDMPQMPWMGGYGNQPSPFGPGGFDGGPPMHGGEVPSEFSLKILCSAGKIGGVIGKGGFNVKQLQQETGASIHVEDALAELEERVIRVSSFEALWNPRSQTIEAILHLQNKTSEFSEKGNLTTRLLVPSSKVGCILGQGGHVINEMRRRTQADIRVYSKEDKPKCAADDEELVQISGNFGVAKDALAEVASRLRARCLRDANAGAGAGAEPATVGPVKGFGPAGSLPGGGPRPSGPVRPGSSSGYEFAQGGGHEYEHSSYPVPPSATTGYPNINSSMAMKMPNNAVGSVVGRGGSNMSEIAGRRLKLQDPQSGGSECVVEIHGSSEHLNAAQNILQSYISSSGQKINPPQGSYQNFNTQQNTYPNINTPQNPYQNMNTPQTTHYQNMNTPQMPYQNMNTQQAPFQNMNSLQAPYQNMNSQQGSYQNVVSQGLYQY
ncbi:RNA-binding KH domain-containing protein RCF3 [Camellia lanceoleosa]|uniref:RNA-binding KH domain-containing protein RCF3 n=1 Tax=Camellia lanceoleosa TaxID=1840588 RepID=A0ACC0HWX0_9ERIC|nr:RNA-binding KH domain-containing protein RCF3 [Camellia lanceoleosa]